MKNIEYTKHVDARLVSRFHLSEDDAATIDQQLTQRNSPAPAHGNAKAVVINEFDVAVYGGRIEKKQAKPIVSHYFPSAKKASFHFGYGWDAVGQALRRASDRGASSATVGGVTVSWADEVAGLDCNVS